MPAGGNEKVEASIQRHVNTNEKYFHACGTVGPCTTAPQAGNPRVK